jgi:hypothetical protein
MPDDIGKEAKKDIEKFRRIRRRDKEGYPLDTKVEMAFWGLAILSVVGMLAAMPFTGPGKWFSGEAWLIWSLGSICFNGGIALAVRQFINL